MTKPNAQKTKKRDESVHENPEKKGKSVSMDQKHELRQLNKKESCESIAPLPFPAIHSSLETTKQIQPHLKQKTILFYSPQACDKLHHSKEGSNNHLVHSSSSQNQLVISSSQNLTFRGGKLTRKPFIFSKEFWSTRKDFFLYPIRAHVRAILLNTEDLQLPYVPPVSFLLKLGRPTSNFFEGKMLQIELSQVDVPLLLQMVRDRTLLEATGKSRKKWGPLHAANALGKLNHGAKLINLLDYNDAWYLSVLPNIIASAGVLALKLSFEYLKDGSRWMKGRMAAVLVIDKIIENQYFKEPKLLLVAAETFKEVLCCPSTQGSLGVQILSSSTWKKILQFFNKPTKIQALWCKKFFSFSCCLCNYVETKHDYGNREPKEVRVEKKKSKLHHGNTGGVEGNKCWWEPLKEGSKQLFGEQRETQIGPSVFLCNFCSGIVCSECSKNCEICNERTCEICFTLNYRLERDSIVCFSCSQISTIGGENKARLTESIEKMDKGKVIPSTAQVKGLGVGIHDFPSVTHEKGDSRKILTNGTGKQSALQNFIVGDSQISSNGIDKSHPKKEDEDKPLKKVTDSKKPKKKVAQVESTEVKNGPATTSKGTKTNKANKSNSGKGSPKDDAWLDGFGEDEKVLEGAPQMFQYEKNLTFFKKEMYFAMDSAFPDDEPAESMEHTPELVELTFFTTEARRSKDRGNIYFKKEQYVEAMKEYENACKLLEGRKRVLEQPPDLFELKRSTLLNVAASQLKLGMYEAVVKSCSSAINVGDCDPCAKGFFRRGMAYFKMGKLSNARRDLSTALRLLPGDKLVQQELDRVTDALSKVPNSISSKQKPKVNPNELEMSQEATQAGKEKEISVKKGVQGGQTKNVGESTNEGKSQKEKSETGKGETVSKVNSSQTSGNDGKKVSSSKSVKVQTKTSSEKTGGKEKVLSENEKKANKAKKVAEKAALRAEAERQAKLKQEREEEEYQRALEKRRKELDEQELLVAARKIQESEEMERQQRIKEMMKNQEEEARQKEREKKLAILQEKIAANERPSYSEDPHSGRISQGSSRDMTSSSTCVTGALSGENNIVSGANLQEIFPFFFPREVESSPSVEPVRQSVSVNTQNQVHFDTNFPPLGSGPSFAPPPTLDYGPPFPSPPLPHLFGNSNNVGYSGYAPDVYQNQSNNFSVGYSGYPQALPPADFPWEDSYSVNTQTVLPENQVFEESFQSYSTFPPTFPPNYPEVNVVSGGGGGGGLSWGSNLGSENLERENKWENEAEESTCAICFEAERDAVVVPCSHLSTCIKCIEKVRNSSRPLCPICRVKIISIITVKKNRKQVK